MLTHTQEQFFVLLRAGLWDKPIDTTELGKDIDWKQIYIISRQQTVVGLIADAITTLPEEMRPPKQIRQRFIKDKLALEYTHKQINETLNKVTECLNREGICSILLKGQGVAQNYPHPTSRSVGDIDLYVGESNYHHANDIIVKNFNAHIIEECIHNMELDVQGSTVEVHRIADLMVNPAKDTVFQKWTKSQLDNNFENKNALNTWKNNGQMIFLPTSIFDAVFIMTHMLRHMFYEGVGLRQLCDWTMHLHKNHSRINADDLNSILEHLDLKKAWCVFSSTAVSLLGLPLEELPISTKIENKYSLHVVQLMFETGNFGKFNKKGRIEKSSSYFSYKWKRFLFHFRYNMKLFPIFPRLTSIFTIVWIKAGIKKTLNKE